MCSAASSASARVRATTIATGSPTQQARSTAMRILRRRLHAGKAGERADPGAGASLASSAPVMTSATPGWRLASAASMRDDPGVGEGAAHEGGVQHARQREVVGVAAAPGHGALGAGARQGAADVAVGLGEGRSAGSCRTRLASASALEALRQRRLDGIDDGVDSRCSGSSCRTGRCGSPRGSWAAARAAARPPSSACRACRSRTAARCAATNASCRSAISPRVGQAPRW